jgi:hypothetical protein
VPLFGGPSVEKLMARGDVSGLSKAVQHKSKEVRESAARALAQLGEAGADALIEPIRELSAKGGGWAGPSEAAKTGLRSVSEAAAIERVWAFVSNPSEPIIAREKVMEIVLTIDPERIPERLRTLSEDRVDQMRRSAVRAVDGLDLEAIRRAGPDTVARFSEVLLAIIGRVSFDVDLRVRVANVLRDVGAPDARSAADEFLRAQHEAAAREEGLEQERSRALLQALNGKRLYSYGKKCDICSTEFSMEDGFEVPSTRFHELVNRGYNPFVTGRASWSPHRARGLTVDHAYEAWLRIVISNRTPWLLCRRCADDLAAFAQAPPASSGATLPWLPSIAPEDLPSEFGSRAEDGGPGADLFEEGVRAWNGGDRDRAASLYAEALGSGLTPTWAAGAQGALGEIHLNRGDLANGVDYLLESLRTRPITAGRAHESAVRLEIIYEEASRHDEAGALAHVAGATARPGIVLAHSYAETLRELVRKAKAEAR